VNLYFDNAATSFPKHPAVGEAIAQYLTECGGTYGRSFYGRALQATTMVERCRDAIGSILGVEGSKICFTAGATSAINLILRGLSLDGKRVAVSGMEHNAVMRPLHHLAEHKGVEIIYLPSRSDGTIDLEAIRRDDLQKAALIVMIHQSNVNGVMQPVREVMAIAGSVPVMLDATQSVTAAGLPDFTPNAPRPDFIIFSGHKALYGPTGVGGAYISHPEWVAPLLYGGTGNNSGSYLMPHAYPDRFEAGTLNIAGICGLLAAINNPLEALHARNDFLALLESIAGIDGIEIFRAISFDRQGETFSITHKTIPTNVLSEKLFYLYGCETRPGLHCSLLSHHTLKTFPNGTLRISLSPYHTTDDLNYLAEAIAKVIKEG